MSDAHGGVALSSASHKDDIMANAKDVATVIQSALEEIGVTGQLEVSMGGQESTKSLGTAKGDDLHVGVIVGDVDDKNIKSKESAPLSKV
jgi:hypothetical protein